MMKKFMILTAMALPLVFAGCNNEDDFEIAEQPSQELDSSTMIGAKIASHGMNISLGADTRLDRTGWEKGDRLGVAWVLAKNNRKLTIADAVGFKTTSNDTDPSETDNSVQKAYAQAKVTGSGDDEMVTFEFQSGTTTGVKNSGYTNEKWYEIEWAGDTYRKTVSASASEYYYTLPIAIDQYKIDWEKEFANLTDNKIYSNHMFEYNNGGFGYYGDIYEGAYFAYWPFTKLGNIEEMKFVLNNEQKIASSEAFYFKNALSISAIDSVCARNEIGDFVTKENTSKAFTIVRVANGLSVNTKFVGAEDISGLKISQVKILTPGKQAFYTTADLNPHKLPVAVYNGVQYDAEKTKEKLTYSKLFDVALTKGAATESISTNVDMALNTPNTVSVLTFPTKELGQMNTEEVKIEVSVVNAEDVPQGKFIINYNKENLDDAGKSNNDALSKLAALLTGGYTQNGSLYSLKEFNTTYFNIPVNLKMSDFVSETVWKVATVEEWNKSVNEINALGLKNATISVTENLEFSSVNPLFPTNAELTVLGGKKMTIMGEATINKNVITNKTDAAMGFDIVNKATLTIAKDAEVKISTIGIEGTLNVNGTITSDGVSGTDAIRIEKSPSLAGVLNLGAEGVIGENISITNYNIIRVTEGTKNEIKSSVTGGKVLSEITNAVNAENIMKKVKVTEITFNGAKVTTQLVENIAYFTKGNTTFSSDMKTSDVNLTVSQGTLTFTKGAVITLGSVAGTTKVTVAAGAKMVIATGNKGVTTYNVINNGIIDLQKDDKGSITTWQTGTLEGSGSIKRL